MSEWKVYPKSKPRHDDGLYLVTVLRNGRLMPEIRMWSSNRFLGGGKVLAFMSIPELYRPPEPFKANCTRKY